MGILGGEVKIMNFDFKVIAKNPPTVSIVCGVACLITAQFISDGFFIGFVGVILIIAGIGLQYLYIN